MDSQRDMVRASLDRDNQKDVTPIRYPLLARAMAEGRVGPGTGLPDLAKRTVRYSCDEDDAA